MFVGSYEYMLFCVIESSMLERGESRLSATLSYSYFMVPPIVFTLLFLNDCVPRLAFKMRIRCVDSLTCIWVSLSTSQ